MTCESIFQNQTCNVNAPCIHGCTCKPRFIRFGTKCILPSECPQTFPGTQVTSSLSIDPSPNEQCPPGTPFVECSADPCTVNRCLGVPSATCIVDRCGSCSAKWYIGNQDVTEECKSRCTSEEAYNQCGTACPPKCSDLNPVCSLQCVAGCFCKPPLIRGPTGKCIQKEQCPGSKLLIGYFNSVSIFALQIFCDWTRIFAR